MIEGAIIPTGDIQKLIELRDELVNHGFGEMRVEIKSLKDNTVRIAIFCGKNYIFFVEKELNLPDFNIF